MASYYTALIALSAYYLVASMSYVLPWVICHPKNPLQDNNTICVDSGSHVEDVISLYNETGQFNEKDFKIISAAEQYFLK